MQVQFLSTYSLLTLFFVNWHLIGNLYLTEMQEGSGRLSNHLLDAFKTDPLRPLVLLLEHHGLLIDRCIILLNDYSFLEWCYHRMYS